MPPVQTVTFSKSDFEDETGKPSPERFLGTFNQSYSQLVQAVNSILGFSGGAEIKSHLSLNGKLLRQLGTPVESGDAVPLGYADAKYGASAIAPQLSQLGDQISQSYRRVSDPTQRENYSSFLNALMSTAPSTNTSLITFAPPSGGVTNVVVSGGLFQQLDGSSVPYSAFNDAITTPGSLTAYYYYLPQGGTSLARVGPFSEDSWANRLNGSFDSNQIVAVAVLNASGGVSAQSAAGATPISGGTVISRL